MRCCVRFVGLLAIILQWPVNAFAQETVFNVPSADVLARGKAYFELDFTYMHSTGRGSLTPRVVLGIGHSCEAGVNLNGLAVPGAVQTTLAPTVKCKLYDGGGNGWTLLAGDDLFIPLQNRSYAAGNYIYAEVVKSWRSKTRATFGAYDFTANVVALANRAGGQFAIEQPLGNRLTLAADWYTGDHNLGYVTPGIIVKATSRLTLYGTYQIGNGGAASGNHQVLIELGWNLN